MPIPADIGVIETMMGTRAGANARLNYSFLERALKDRESKSFAFPAQFMFTAAPFKERTEELPQGHELLLPFMDRCGVEIAMVGCAPDGSGLGNAERVLRLA